VGPTDYFCFILFLITPLSFLAWWARMRLGYDKRWFVMPAAPFISRNFYFALPTAMLGVSIGVLGGLLVALDPNSEVALYLAFITFGLWATSFVLAYLEPGWMSPAWYRWLKKEHGDILPYLAQEAHLLGREKWLAQVQTQADLEQWVAEMRRKYRR
jgi:hypothetical protein